MNNIFEKFNFDISIYQEYKLKQQQIVDYFDKQIQLKAINIIFRKCKILIGIIIGIPLIYLFYISTKSNDISIYENFLSCIFGFLFFVVYPWLLIYSIFEDTTFICNIITFGKYNKINKQIVTLEKEKQKHLEKINNSLIAKVTSFEQEFYNYYTQEVEDFYQTKLYRKRTSGEGFYEDLLEFESMINDLEKVNDIFLTQKFYLQEYTDYVNKRKFDVEFQDIFNEEKDKKPKVNYKDEKAKELNEFVNDITQVKQVESPENKFRQPQKVNWDKVNQRNKETGLKGEELVLEMEREYLQSIGKSDLAQRIRHVSVVDGDGAGYDILSYFDDGREKYIEVKSTTQSIGTQYFLSKNELDFLNSNKEDAFIYRVSFINEKEIILQALSVKDIVEKYDLSPIQYSVKLKVK